MQICRKLNSAANTTLTFFLKYSSRPIASGIKPTASSSYLQRTVTATPHQLLLKRHFWHNQAFTPNVQVCLTQVQLLVIHLTEFSRSYTQVSVITLFSL